MCLPKQTIGAIAIPMVQSAFMRSSWTSSMWHKRLAPGHSFQSAFMRSSWTSARLGATQSSAWVSIRLHAVKLDQPDLTQAFSGTTRFNPPSCGQAGPAQLGAEYDYSSKFQSAFMRSSWTSQPSKINDLLRVSIRLHAVKLDQRVNEGNGIILTGFNPPSCGQAGPAQKASPQPR